MKIFLEWDGKVTHETTLDNQTSATMRRVKRNQPNEFVAKTGVADFREARSADPQQGGCLVALFSMRMSLTNMIVSGGIAVIGGGIASINSNMVITGSTITKNVLFSVPNLPSRGAGIFITNSASFEMRESVLSENSILCSGCLLAGGAGLFVARSKNLLFDSCNATNNTISTASLVWNAMYGAGGT